jgi:hypothetical protein
MRDDLFLRPTVISGDYKWSGTGPANRPHLKESGVPVAVPTSTEAWHCLVASNRRDTAANAMTLKVRASILHCKSCQLGRPSSPSNQPNRLRVASIIQNNWESRISVCSVSDTKSKIELDGTNTVKPAYQAVFVPLRTHPQRSRRSL